MFKHRIKSPLGQGLDRGKRFFIFHGKGIKDCYLEHIALGMRSLHETLQRYFLKEKEYDYFIAIVDNRPIVYRLNMQDQIVEVPDFWEIEQPKGPLKPGKGYDPSAIKGSSGVTSKGAGQLREKSSVAADLKQKMEGNGTDVKNCLNILTERIMRHGEKYAVFFQDFEWLASLYGSDADIPLIKQLKEYSIKENVVTIVSLEDADMLKEYHFETEESNTIYVGNPSANEIKYAYLRKLLQNKTFGHGGYQRKLFSLLDDISQSIASSKKSMRDAMHVLDTVVFDMEREYLDKEDFEIAIERIIEEKVYLKDVILDEKIKKEVESAIDNFVSDSRTSTSRKGMILTGHPGTGKTHLVRALANEKNCYFMAPTLSDLKGEYVGETSGKVKRIFDEARANMPTILFIDEADTVFPSRDLGGGNSDSYNLDMVNQFLQEIDGMKNGKQKIFTIAATNRMNIIDRAIRSRLSDSIEIGLPGPDERIRIFDSKLEKYDFILSGKPYCNEIREKTEKMSGRDIYNIVDKLMELHPEFNYAQMKKDGVDMEPVKVDYDKEKEAFIDILMHKEREMISDLCQKIPIEITAPKDIENGIDSVIGYESVKKKIMRQANVIKSTVQDSFIRSTYNIVGNQGILLYGPPGNAKSELARAVAKENEFYFVKVLSKDFVSDSPETQLANLQRIFDDILQLSKITSEKGIVLFFDEFDALAGVQNLNKIIRCTLLDYLANQNGLRAKDGKILLIAATNFKYLLDSAVIRKGRIDEHLFMDNPSKEHGVMIISQKFGNDPMIDLEPALAEKIYNKIHDRKYAELYNDETERMAMSDEERIHVTEKDDARPSGADLVTVCNELKADAFEQQFDKLDENGSVKLLVDEKIIDDYFKYQ